MIKKPVKYTERDAEIIRNEIVKSYGMNYILCYGGIPLNKAEYRPRIIDKKVEEYLEAFGAVCIEGPKWCGKTWTSSYHSRSTIFVGDPSSNFQNRKLAELDPLLILEGVQPRLIDEWQEVPALWDAVRYRVDQNTKKGQFILTGSATPINSSLQVKVDTGKTRDTVYIACSSFMLPQKNFPRKL